MSKTSISIVLASLVLGVSFFVYQYAGVGFSESGATLKGAPDGEQKPSSVCLYGSDLYEQCMYERENGIREHRTCRTGKTQRDRETACQREQNAYDRFQNKNCESKCGILWPY